MQRVREPLRRLRFLSTDASSLRGRDLDTMFSFTGAEQRTLLRLSAGLKARLRAADSAPYQPLVGRTLSMIFQKRSTRTRVSAEGGFAQLGGHAIFLGACARPGHSPPSPPSQPVSSAAGR